MKVIKNIITHWKTSVAGLVIGMLTLMLWKKSITVTEWAEGLGVVVTLIGILAKDWDKPNE